MTEKELDAMATDAAILILVGILFLCVIARLFLPWD